MNSTFLVLHHSSARAEVLLEKKRVSGCGECRRGKEKKHCCDVFTLQSSAPHPLGFCTKEGTKYMHTVAMLLFALG